MQNMLNMNISSEYVDKNLYLWYNYKRHISGLFAPPTNSVQIRGIPVRKILLLSAGESCLPESFCEATEIIRAGSTA